MRGSGKEPRKDKTKEHWVDWSAKFWVATIEGKDAVDALCVKMLYEGKETFRSYR